MGISGTRILVMAIAEPGARIALPDLYHMKIRISDASEPPKIEYRDPRCPD